MAHVGESSPRSQPLSADVEVAARKCGEALSKKSAWKTVQVGEDPTETCGVWNPEVEEDDLRVICNSFVKSFPPLQKKSATEIRLNAVRFTRSVHVPMTPGLSVELVPVFIHSVNTPTIANIPLRVGGYVSLASAERVDIREGSCICLLVLSQR